MLYFVHILLAILLHRTSAAEYEPFLSPLNDVSPINLFKRAESKCGTSCSSMGANVCCGKKAVCALDQAGNVACCPHNAACTGTIAAGAAPTNVPGGQPSAPIPGAAISHAISGTSTLSNQYYPFPVLPTPFANEADCSSAFSACQAESAKCTGYVEGGGYGVTIAGQGRQITQQAAIPAASAESICSSLSQQACHGLQQSQCPTSNGAKATDGGTGFIAGDTSSDGSIQSGHCRIGMLGLMLAMMMTAHFSWF